MGGAIKLFAKITEGSKMVLQSQSDKSLPEDLKGGVPVQPHVEFQG